MERRTSYRKAIHHEAVVCLQGGAKWPCVISDFCDQGMFLTYELTASKAIKAELSMSPTQVFSLRFLGPKGVHYEVAVEVARKIECATGVRFIGEYDAEFQALQAIALTSKPAQVVINDSKLILTDCIKEILSLSDPLWENVFPALEAALKEEAVGASTDQSANMYMELVQQLKRKNASITQRFFLALKDAVSFLRTQYVHQADVTDNLSLIDKGEFEDWLTSRVLITKAESKYHEYLLPLRVRMDAVGFSAEEYKHSVFGPELFVLAYRHAIHGMVVNNTVERVLFKVFENSFMQDLAPLYERLNEVLAGHGVLADFDASKQLKKTPSKLGANDTAEDTPAEEEGSANAVVPEQNNTLPKSGAGRGSVRQRVTNELPVLPKETPQRPYGSPLSDAPLKTAEQDSVLDTSAPFQSSPMSRSDDGSDAFRANQAEAQAAFDKVLGLMKSLKTGLGDRPDSAITAAAREEKYSEDEMTQGLSFMQTASQDIGDESDERSLLERVLGNLETDGDESKGIDEDQQVAIDVVDRFFVSLKHNPRLTIDAKTQLNKLEIPLLKVLLRDENFFSESSHSVRQVMNRIAQLGAKGARLSPLNQSKVDGLVKQILQNFDQDTAVFDQALQELDEMVSKQASSYTKNVERVAAAAEGVYRVDQAKAAVVEALNERLGGRPVPKAVQTLIDHGWKDLLRLTHIKYGSDSDEWGDHLAIVDTLMEFSEKPDSKLDMKQILPRIQEGLRTVSGNDRPPEVVRDELKSLIQSAPYRKQEMVTSVIEEVEETEETREARNTKVLQELKPWIRRARSLQAGSWVQLLKSAEDPQFMRLVWVAKGYSKFVFVNHQGMKVVELGLFKFARYLKSQKIKPDPNYEVPIVNQGLDDMIKDVYEKLAFESSHDPNSGVLNYQESCRRIRSQMLEGDRHAPCGLLYVRLMAEKGEGLRPAPAETTKDVGGLLLELREGDAITGRLNAYDFVLFSIDDDMELLSVRLSERLALYREDGNQSAFIFEIGEANSTLGFINPESLFRQASADLTPVPLTSITDDEVKRPLPTASPAPEKDLIEPLEDQVKLDQHLADIGSEEVSHESTVDSKAFEIFYQRAIGISADAANDEQCELLCSEVGSGVSFVPELQRDAIALDCWWIERIARRYQEASPDWEGLGQVRLKISGYALNSDTVPDRLAELVTEGKIQPEEIWFDIYDSSVISDTHAAADRLAQLAELGFRFCLDQFGTVRAPFYLMKALPVHMIKIDESYIEALNGENAEKGPADSVVEVAHYLGKSVLASAVDSAICLQRMRTFGIDFVQGSTVADYERLCDG